MSKKKKAQKKKCHEVEEASGEEIDNEALKALVLEIKKMASLFYQLTRKCKPHNTARMLAKELEILIEKGVLVAALEKKDDEKDEAGKGNKESSGQNKKKPEEEEDDKNNEETALFGASNKQDTKDTNRNDSARASKNESGRNGSGDGKSDCCDEVMRAISEVMETQDSRDADSHTPEWLKSLMHGYLFQAVYHLIVNGGAPYKPWCKKGNVKRQMLEECHQLKEDPCQLAWRTNGVGSIYDPEQTPLAHYMKAFPKNLKLLLREQKRKKRQAANGCARQPYKCPSYWCPDHPSKHPPFKQDSFFKPSRSSQAKPQWDPDMCRIYCRSKDAPDSKQMFAHRSEVAPETPLQAENVTSEERECLRALIKHYNIPRTKEEPWIKKEEKKEGKKEKNVETMEQGTQMSFCKVCDDYNLMKDVYFYGTKCQKVLSAGKPLSNPCWTDKSHTFRGPVHLDWTSFFENLSSSVEILPQDKRWLSEECSYIKFYDYKFMYKKLKDELKPEPFYLPDDTIADPFVGSSEDYIEQAVYFSNDIPYLKTNEFYKWEPKSMPMPRDARDQLEEEIMANVYYPYAESEAFEDAYDSIEDLPTDLLDTITEREEEAELPVADEPAADIWM